MNNTTNNQLRFIYAAKDCKDLSDAIHNLSELRKLIKTYEPTKVPKKIRTRYAAILNKLVLRNKLSATFVFDLVDAYTIDNSCDIPNLKLKR